MARTTDRVPAAPASARRPVGQPLLAALLAFCRVVLLHTTASAPEALRRCAALAALVLLLFSPAYGQKTDRAKAVGHRMFCMCGCKQILVECNHVGCTMSTAMLKKLDAEVASSKSDDLVLQAFVQEFGAEVIAEPPAKGFNWLAWIMPFAVVGAGLFLIRGILSRWSQPAPALPSGQAVAPELLERIRRETEQDD